MTARQALQATEGERSPYDGKRMSEEEYLALPEDKPYLEWVDGVVVQKAMPNEPHSDLVVQFILVLSAYARTTGGRVGTELRTLLTAIGRKHRLPDVCYYSPGRPRAPKGVPTLAIEVRSPDETMTAQREKCRQYRENGVDECWLVDPGSRTVEVFEGDGPVVRLAAGDKLQSPNLPGFTLELAALFAILDED